MANARETGKKIIKHHWLDGNITQSETLGTLRTTAQVDPFQLTNALKDATKGIRIIRDKVIGFDFDSECTLENVVLHSGEKLKADVAVVAMGPWSSQLASSMPLCKNFPIISGSRAHSIVVKADVPAEAMFTQLKDENGKLKEPEIYPRENGTVYICGEGDEGSLPSDPAQIFPDLEACKTLHEAVGEVSSIIKEAPVLKNQACFLPCSPDGIPVIGAVTPYKNIYLGTVHGTFRNSPNIQVVWGRLQRPHRCHSCCMFGRKQNRPFPLISGGNLPIKPSSRPLTSFFFEKNCQKLRGFFPQPETEIGLSLSFPEQIFCEIIFSSVDEFFQNFSKF